METVVLRGCGGGKQILRFINRVGEVIWAPLVQRFER